MGKGEAWVNGQSIGRFWVSFQTPKGKPSQTWYAVHTNIMYLLLFQYFGHTTLHLSIFRYNVPRSFLKPTGNLLVLLEEENGDPLGISLDKVSVTQVCGHVSETHLPPVSKWLVQKTQNQNNTKTKLGRRPKIQLSCPPKKSISKVLFSSFGNPSGDCKTYATGSCHSSNSKAIVEKVSISFPFFA